MFSENHKNRACEFAVDTMSYLYGEIESIRKAAIETHLSDCAQCAEDAASFAVVRSSIKEWRGLEFDNLPAPALALPPSENRVRASRMETIRAYFSFSPRLLTASLAALVIFAGSVMFFYNRAGDQTITENFNRKTTAPTETPLVESREEKTASPEIANNDKIVERTVANSVETKKVSSQNLSAAKKIVFPSKAPQRAGNAKITSAAKPARGGKPALQARKQPTLAGSSDADEDKSLRLADILEEISMR